MMSPPTAAADSISPPRLVLPWRLALLTGLLAVALVVSATEIALRLAERTRRADLLTESVDLSNTLGAYLTRIAPTGDPSTLAVGLAGWSRKHITETSAVAFLHGRDGFYAAAASDTAVEREPDATDSTALAEHQVLARFVEGPAPFIQVAVPLGPNRSYGVLDVHVAMARFSEWARAERKRAYLLGIAAALLIAAGTWGLVSWWVGRPLRALTGAMAGAHAGATVGPAAPEIGANEFRHLARRYNLLRDALADRERESEARAALRGLEERAKSYDRLALSEETAAGFAHEIGTPLNTMKGHLQLLGDDLRSLAGADPARERVTLLLGQLDRVARIVRAGLSRATWPEPAHQPADLGALVAGLLRFLEPAFTEAGVRVTAQPVTPTAPAVRAVTDRDLVEQVLLNLLKNAIEALPRGGEVRVVWGLEGQRPFIDVSDNGPGIDPEVAAHLFQPFVTSKGSGGTGLGLAVSRRLAHSLGGELSYLPGGAGTRWRLYLSQENAA